MRIQILLPTMIRIRNNAIDTLLRGTRSKCTGIELIICSLKDTLVTKIRTSLTVLFSIFYCKMPQEKKRGQRQDKSNSEQGIGTR